MRPAHWLGLPVVAVVAVVAALGACTSSSANDGASAPDAGGFEAGLPDGSGPANDDAGADADADADGACSKAPPSGFSNPAPAPAGASGYGEYTWMTLDDDDHPMIAFSADGAGAHLFFVRWDGCAGAWTTPVDVDDVAQDGIVEGGNEVRQVAIARDPTTGAVYIAYTKVVTEFDNVARASIWVAKSIDKGVTWSKEKVSTDAPSPGQAGMACWNPAITVAGGKVYVAYWQEFTHCDAPTGASGPICGDWLLEGDVGSWQRQVVPRVLQAETAYTPIGLAGDSAGNVALAYLTVPYSASDATSAVVFWRPGTNPLVVFDSNGIQNDDPSVSLAFFGTKPRILAHLKHDASDTQDMLYAQSDDGATWSTPVPIPRDGTLQTLDTQSLAIDAQGHLALTAQVGISGGGAVACGWPKVARSNDGVTWTVCGGVVPPVPPNGYSNFGGDYSSAAFGRDGKLQVAFFDGRTDAPYGHGVLYWHE